MTPRDEPFCAEWVSNRSAGACPPLSVMRNGRLVLLSSGHAYCDCVVAMCQAAWQSGAGVIPPSNGRRVCSEGFSPSGRAKARTTSLQEPLPPGWGRSRGEGGLKPRLLRLGSGQAPLQGRAGRAREFHSLAQDTKSHRGFPALALEFIPARPSPRAISQHGHWTTFLGPGSPHPSIRRFATIPRQAQDVAQDAVMCVGQWQGW